MAPYDYVFLWEWDEDVDATLASSTPTSTCASSGATRGKTSYTSSSGGPRAGEVLHRNTVGGPGNCSDLHRPPCSGFVEVMGLRVAHGEERPRAVHGWGLDGWTSTSGGAWRIQTSKGRRHVVVKRLKRLPVLVTEFFVF